MTIEEAVKRYNTLHGKIKDALIIKRILHDNSIISEALTVQERVTLDYIIDYYMDDCKKELKEEFRQTFKDKEDAQ